MSILRLEVLGFDPSKKQTKKKKLTNLTCKSILLGNPRGIIEPLLTHLDTYTLKIVFS